MKQVVLNKVFDEMQKLIFSNSQLNSKFQQIVENKQQMGQVREEEERYITPEKSPNNGGKINSEKNEFNDEEIREFIQSLTKGH